MSILASLSRRTRSGVTHADARPLVPSDRRFLSQAECAVLLTRADSFAVGGGTTELSLDSTWTGNVRWARNQSVSSGDTRNNDVWLTRSIHGAGDSAPVIVDNVDDARIHAAVRRAERLLRLDAERLMDVVRWPPDEPYAHPNIFSEATYGLDAERRAKAMQDLTHSARDAGMFAAGYVEVSATGRSVMNSAGRMLYYPSTSAQYTVTVRDPKGTGSGWAGVDWSDWTRIDGETLSAIALKKCLTSRNPVAVEPGRYTAILEPQAVADLCDVMFNPGWFNRSGGEDPNPNGSDNPYNASPNQSKIGQKMFDERITITADPMDPDLGFLPFDRYGNVFHKATWWEHGILKNLPYGRGYAISMLGQNSSLFSSGAYRMGGGTTSIDEMVASTERGVLVTRFSNVFLVDKRSLLTSGYTRDGLWLIEKGKISKPIKNFRFTESPLFILNNVEQLGAPQRVFHPGAPVIVPPLKARDFSFTSLADAV